MWRTIVGLLYTSGRVRTSTLGAWIWRNGSVYVFQSPIVRVRVVEIHLVASVRVSVETTEERDRDCVRGCVGALVSVNSRAHRPVVAPARVRAHARRQRQRQRCRRHERPSSETSSRHQPPPPRTRLAPNGPLRYSRRQQRSFRVRITPIPPYHLRSPLLLRRLPFGSSRARDPHRTRARCRCRNRTLARSR